MKRNVLILAAALVLSGTAIAQTGTDSANSNGSTTTRNDDTHRGFDYGWLGLIGLAGLAGLRKNDNRTIDTTRNVR